jgi:hypothetical protein
MARTKQTSKKPRGKLSPKRLFDGRSPSVRKGEISYRKDGRVDGRCAAARSGTVKVTKAGNVDMRSASVRGGSLKLKAKQQRKEAKQQRKEPKGQRSVNHVLQGMLNGNIDLDHLAKFGSIRWLNNDPERPRSDAFRAQCKASRALFGDMKCAINCNESSSD